MRESFKKGFNFGLTSGTITTLGMMTGLYATTNSKIVLLGGIITIATSDAFSDALGMHISEESQKDTSEKEVWEATISTFLTKFFYAMTFVVPVFFFELKNAIIISILYGMMVISGISYKAARQNSEPARRVIAEHLVVAIVVLFLAYGIGHQVRDHFSGFFGIK